MLTFPKGKGIPQGIYVISSVCLSFYLWKDLVGVFFFPLLTNPPNTEKPFSLFHFQLSIV